MSEVIKLIALDLDGTLALDNHAISPATREALEDIHRDGVEVVIATGRRYRTTRYVMTNLGFDVCVVCNGGALVKNRLQNTLTQSTFSKMELKSVVSLARSLGLSLSAQRDSHTHGGSDFVIDGTIPWNDQVKTYHAENAEYSSSADLVEQDDHYLVLGAFDREENLREFDRQLHSANANRFSTVIVPHLKTAFHYCEITLNQVTKWHGLSHLADYLTSDTSLGAIKAENICAVGDQLNDMAMVQAAGIGVAMGNGNAELKAAANLVCGRHDEDGILEVVDHVRDHNDRVTR